MIEMGAFEAKTHFSDILKKVSEGEEFCITNRGKKVAIIMSLEQAHELRAKQAYTRLRELRREHPIGSAEEIIKWRDEGRK